MTTRHIFPEQDATLIIRIPSSIKSWYADLANLTPDRNMSDFARDALRAYMMERGGEEWLEEERERAAEREVAGTRWEIREEDSVIQQVEIPFVAGPIFDGSWQVTGEDVGEYTRQAENLAVVERFVAEEVPAPPSPLLPEQPRDFAPIAPLEQDDG